MHLSLKYQGSVLVGVGLSLYNTGTNPVQDYLCTRLGCSTDGHRPIAVLDEVQY